MSDMTSDPFRELRVDRPDEDLGEFDWSSAQLHVLSGEWFPHLEPVVVEALGGSVKQFWNRWEHHFLLENRRAIATYWFNEFEYCGGSNYLRLLGDQPAVDLVVTGEETALAATRPVLEALAARCRSEAGNVPAAVPYVHAKSEAGDAWEAAARVVTGESRPWGSSFWSSSTEQVTEEQLAKAELDRGVQLPALMREMLLVRNGGRMRGFFDDENWVNQAGSDIRPFGGLYAFPWFYDKQMTPDDWKPTRPLSLLVPFTGDGHADVCLDYRKRGPNQEPQITLVSTESEIIRLVADSFPAYVVKLRDDDLRLPSAPGVAPQQIVEQLRENFGDVLVEQPYGSRLRISVGESYLCDVDENRELLEYDDCNSTVQFNRGMLRVEDVCRCLHGAGLLEGSLPQQSWDPSGWQPAAQS